MIRRVGEVVIKVTLIRGEEEITFPVTLTGFMTGDENIVEEIKSQIVILDEIQNRTIMELNAIVSETETPILLTQEEIEKLGMNVILPPDLKGVKVMYTLLPKGASAGQKSSFTLNLILSKGEYIDYLTSTIYSVDEVQFETELEMLRVKKLLTNGAIETTIENASEILPSRVEIDEHTKPYYDPVVHLYNVTTTFTRKYVNDANGELVIEATFEKPGEETKHLDIKLFGFQTTKENEVISLKAADLFFEKMAKTLEEFSYIELDKFVEMTENKLSITANNLKQILQKSSIELQWDQKIGVKGKISIVNISKYAGKQVRYKLIVEMHKGTSEQVKEYTFVSCNVFPTYCQQEKERISSLLVNGKIKTNLPEADKTLPSEVVLTGGEVLFDNYFPEIAGVNKKANILYVNNEQGELLIQLIFERENEKTEYLDVTLTGFMTIYDSDSYIVNFVQEFLKKEVVSIELPIEKLDKLLTMDGEMEGFNAEIISALGLEAELPKEFLRTKTVYSLEIVQREFEKQCVYMLTIQTTKGSVSEVFRINTSSTDNLLFDTQKEKNRVSKLLVEGKALSNIENHWNLLPSKVEVFGLSQVFESGISIEGVETTYTVKDANDELGELTLIATFTKQDQLTQTLEIVLTGFKTIHQENLEWVNNAKNEIVVTDLSKKTISELTQLETMDYMELNAQAIEKLGFEIDLMEFDRFAKFEYKLYPLHVIQNENAIYILSIKITKENISSEVSFVVESIDVS